jgi:hypothetical protein
MTDLLLLGRRCLLFVQGNRVLGLVSIGCHVRFLHGNFADDSSLTTAGCIA